MGFGFLIPLIILGGVIYAIINLVDLNQNKQNNNGSDDPLNILNERYARGEIGEEDYGRIKNKILSS